MWLFHRWLSLFWSFSYSSVPHQGNCPCEHLEVCGIHVAMVMQWWCWGSIRTNKGVERLHHLRGCCSTPSGRMWWLSIWSSLCLLSGWPAWCPEQSTNPAENPLVSGTLPRPQVAHSAALQRKPGSWCGLLWLETTCKPWTYVSPINQSSCFAFYLQGPKWPIWVPEFHHGLHRPALSRPNFLNPEPSFPETSWPRVCQCRTRCNVESLSQ